MHSISSKNLFNPSLKIDGRTSFYRVIFELTTHLTPLSEYGNLSPLSFGVRRVSRRFEKFWSAVRPRTALEYFGLRHALVSL